MVCLAQEGAATLIGAVIDPYGSPVNGCVVTIWSEHIRGFNYSASTDVAGQFRFASVLPGSYRIWDKTVIQLAPDQHTSLPNEVRSPAGDCARTGVIATRRLAPGDNSGTLRGSVVKSTGSGLPIVGASVSLDCVGCVTTTNEAGQFNFSNLKPGEYTINISMTGFYWESFSGFIVAKNLDWTYGRIELDKCPTEKCGHRRLLRRPKVIILQ